MEARDASADEEHLAGEVGVVRAGRGAGRHHRLTVPLIGPDRRGDDPGRGRHLLQ